MSSETEVEQEIIDDAISQEDVAALEDLLDAVYTLQTSFDVSGNTRSYTSPIQIKKETRILDVARAVAHKDAITNGCEPRNYAPGSGRTSDRLIAPPSRDLHPSVQILLLARALRTRTAHLFVASTREKSEAQPSDANDESLEVSPVIRAGYDRAPRHETIRPRSAPGRVQHARHGGPTNLQTVPMFLSESSAVGTPTISTPHPDALYFDEAAQNVGPHRGTEDSSFYTHKPPLHEDTAGGSAPESVSSEGSSLYSDSWTTPTLVLCDSEEMACEAESYSEVLEEVPFLDDPYTDSKHWATTMLTRLKEFEAFHGVTPGKKTALIVSAGAVKGGTIAKPR